MIYAAYRNGAPDIAMTAQFLKTKDIPTLDNVNKFIKFLLKHILLWVLLQCLWSSPIWYEYTVCNSNMSDVAGEEMISDKKVRQGTRIWTYE